MSAPSANTLVSVGLRYGLLAFYVALVYVLVLVFGGVTSESAAIPWWVNLVALLIIAATFLPMHGWLRGSVNQLVFGQHDNPYTLLARFSQYIDGYGVSDTVLTSLAATLATTFRLPYVAIETDGVSAAPAAVFGTPLPATEVLRIPLAYGAVRIGALVVSPRHPREPLSHDEIRLLVDLTRQVAITLHAAELTSALQASREQLVLAREEERRRIRRDLHDGLGPALASLRLQLSALRHHVGDNLAALSLIDELRRDVRTATGEIRRLVYDLRPPMLDEFGLLGALRNLELAEDQLRRSVEAPEPLPPLPAALEVAVYRIAAEALHNVVRHARATRCTVRLALDDTILTLMVSDDGVGLPAGYLPGVGHHAMQERAAELGGNVTIGRGHGGGACVTATFPLKG